MGLGAVGVTAYYAILTRRLWRVTDAQVTLSREVFRSSHRPWINPVIEFSGTQPDAAVFSVSLSNSGNFPAWLKAVSFRVILGEEAVAEDVFGGDLVIFPGSPPVIRTLLVKEMDVVMRASKMSYVGMRSKSIFAKVEADYEFHGDPARTEASFEFAWSDGEMKLRRSSAT